MSTWTGGLPRYMWLYGDNGPVIMVCDHWSHQGTHVAQIGGGEVRDSRIANRDPHPPAPTFRSDQRAEFDEYNLAHARVHEADGCPAVTHNWEWVPVACAVTTPHHLHGPHRNGNLTWRTALPSWGMDPAEEDALRRDPGAWPVRRTG